MLELIGVGLAAAAGLFGHVKARDFVRRRLRFTKFVKKPMRLGVVAGVATAVVAVPVVSLVPFVGLGAGTAVFLGFAVGAGTGLGARDVQGNKALPRDLDD